MDCRNGETHVIDKNIILQESGGVDRNEEFVRIGIPFAEGELPGQTGLAIVNPQGAMQPVQAVILKRWNEGSVKWLLLDFTASVPANGSATYRLVYNHGRISPAPLAIHITPGSDTWIVDTGRATFSIDARRFRPFTSVTTGDRELLTAEGSGFVFNAVDADNPAPIIESIVVEADGPLRATLRIEGCFSNFTGPSPKFFSRLDFFAGSSRVTLEFTLRNPRPALHHGGLWDLGDAHSLFFRELALEFSFSGNTVDTIICSPEPNAPLFHPADISERLTVYQESSGGNNWNSPIHRNRDGIVSLAFKGYEMRTGNHPLFKGRRAVPVVWCGTDTTGIAVVMPRFWQEFPKAIDVDGRSLLISLFPSSPPDVHELQGGEQKTTVVYLDFATTPAGLEWARVPLSVVAALEVYRHSGVIPDLPVSSPDDNGPRDLVDRFISGPGDLLYKRESIDEFGWRNFGELFADHEAVYHRGEEAFISHYNNQYDICAGMYRKFLATGNPLWGDLAADLARHVLDIDIYHTTEDREEYNHGLFWHTDHYVAAGRATHRTFSAEQIGTRDPRVCGGGPGAEHCYTTGLLYHYFMTGNRDYQEAVIHLAQWCIVSLTGSQTVLASIKKAGRYVSLLRSTPAGARPAFPRYPLSRGTGNAITACLDAFEVGGGRFFLEQAEEFVRGAIHPADDISVRDLLNAEDSWSYTVFLVAVTKYIDKKSERGELDDSREYAIHCLLVYAEWMLRHEYPYLDKPEQLEFPNETWAAQDLRKSVIFHRAARHAAPDRRDALLEKARFFFETTREELARHGTSRCTRPLALMFQNGWIGAQLDGQIMTSSAPSLQALSFGRPIPQLGIQTVALRIGTDLWRSMLKSTPQHEIAWLNARLQSKKGEPSP